MEKRINNIEIEGARFAYKPNFSGNKTNSNPNGFRQFTVELDDDVAHKLEEDGWNIKWKPLPAGKWMEGDPLTATLDVRIRTDGYYPPEVYLINNGKKHRLYDDELHLLDENTFDNIDIIIRPRFWEYNGKHGIKAYLKALYASGLSGSITSKYIDIPMAED